MWRHRHPLLSLLLFFFFSSMTQISPHLDGYMVRRSSISFTLSLFQTHSFFCTLSVLYPLPPSFFPLSQPSIANITLTQSCFSFFFLLLLLLSVLFSFLGIRTITNTLQPFAFFSLFYFIMYTVKYIPTFVPIQGAP